MTTRVYDSCQMMLRVGVPWPEVCRLESSGDFPQRMNSFGEFTGGDFWDVDEIDAWIKNRK